ncbi:LysR family transcriptional regulator, partial [Klebsiella aerogenes]
WQDRICIISRPGHPLQKEKRLSLAAMLDYPWIMPPPLSTPMLI